MHSVSRAVADDHLIWRLPPVRGRLRADAPLSAFTWFRVGGPAEVLFVPADIGDLAGFLAALPADVPVTTIGVASNLLVRDGGVAGVVIRLGPAFADIAVDGETIAAGAAALDARVAESAAAVGLGGLEFLSGIPGTIGGAAAMNAGCYGAEIKDVLVSLDTVNRSGERRTISRAELPMQYRAGGLPANAIVVAATLRGHTGLPDEIRARMAEITAARQESQPLRARTGGSTFRNPDGHKAWALIDAAGCRGLQVGGARVSDFHCNFLIADETASAADIERLGEIVRARVRAEAGIDLQWEVKRIGAPAGAR